MPSKHIDGTAGQKVTTGLFYRWGSGYRRAEKEGPGFGRRGVRSGPGRGHLPLRHANRGKVEGDRHDRLAAAAHVQPIARCFLARAASVGRVAMILRFRQVDAPAPDAGGLDGHEGR